MRSSGVSQRKKLEEQNSQAIRQLLNEPANKYCFDCGVRGPTCVNMTIGSYCCMHCSGLLRGLHPPHRIKSISMSTFTNDEVERLRTLGNAINAGIYLGLYSGTKTFGEEVRSHLIEKYENRRWYVSPGDVERQKQLLEDCAANRRNSVSALSQKSNQSAPPNLHPQPQTARSGPIDLLTGDLFDLSLSSTPVQQSAPTTAIQQPTNELKSPQDNDWADLFSKPINNTVVEPSSFPLHHQTTIPAPLKFPMPNIPPPKPKEHLSAANSIGHSNTSQTVNHQHWESFNSMPKSATVGGINVPQQQPLPTTNSALDELFSNFDLNQLNGQTKTNDSLFGTKSQNESNITFPTTFDNFTSQQSNNGSTTKTQQQTSSWNPFLA